MDRRLRSAGPEPSPNRAAWDNIRAPTQLNAQIPDQHLLTQHLRDEPDQMTDVLNWDPREALDIEPHQCLAQLRAVGLPNDLRQCRRRHREEITTDIQQRLDALGDPIQVRREQIEEIVSAGLCHNHKHRDDFETAAVKHYMQNLAEFARMQPSIPSNEVVEEALGNRRSRQPHPRNSQPEDQRRRSRSPAFYRIISEFRRRSPPRPSEDSQLRAPVALPSEASTSIPPRPFHNPFQGSESSDEGSPPTSPPQEPPLIDLTNDLPTPHPRNNPRFFSTVRTAIANLPPRLRPEWSARLRPLTQELTLRITTLTPAHTGADPAVFARDIDDLYRQIDRVRTGADAASARESERLRQVGLYNRMRQHAHWERGARERALESDRQEEWLRELTEGRNRSSGVESQGVESSGVESRGGCELHVQRRDIDGECSICYDELDGREMQGLAWCRNGCGQSFHEECIGTWLGAPARMVGGVRRQRACPYCRREWVLLPCTHQYAMPGSIEVPARED